MKTKYTGRRCTGQAFTMLSLLLSTMVIGVLGVFAFEFARYTSYREQLRTATDAAALGAAAALAASNMKADATAAHNAAMDFAKLVFMKNEVFGAILDPVVDTRVSEPPQTLTAGQTVLSFKLFTKDGTSVSAGNPDGKIIQVTASHGYFPLFATFLGLKNFVAPIIVSSEGGVPPLDIMIAIDVSGSMDDQTKVTLVNRTWNKDTNKVDYTPVQSGTIWNIVQPSATGTAFNAYYPQRLHRIADFANGHGFNGTLRGTPNTGTPPGNYPAGDAVGTGDFTDVVANVASDGSNDQNPDTMQFPVTSKNGFVYPNLASLVEAARGNLDTAKAFSDSQASKRLGPPGPDHVDVKAGYRADYENLACNTLNPLRLAQNAFVDFLDLMNTNTDCHFGMITFGNGDVDNQKADGSGYLEEGWQKIAGNGYVSGESDDPYPCRLPLFALSKAANNYTQIKDFWKGSDGAQDTDSTQDVLAFSSTLLVEHVTEAVKELTSPDTSRPDAKRALVIFTDGFATGSQDTSDIIKKCKDAGIPIYCVGLQQDPSVQAQQQAFLDPLAKQTGGAAYYTNNSQELQTLFRFVARNLTQLVRLPGSNQI